MKMPGFFAGLVLGSSVLLGSAAAGSERVGLQVGDRFPDLVLPSLKGGEPLSVASFRGRKLALHVWASW